MSGFSSAQSNSEFGHGELTEVPMRFLLIAVLATGFAALSASCAEPDEKTAKELKVLEGVWAEDPPKGDGRQNAVRFQDGKMGWKSMRYQGGEPLIGHSKGYEVRLDPSAKPKQITLTRGAGADQETLLGIYEVEGDTLKMALGREKDRPKKFDDKDAQLMTLKKVKPKE
jgi:uncharacterized protein (TIGR03067 family)